MHILKKKIIINYKFNKNIYIMNINILINALKLTFSLMTLLLNHLLY